jgi:hypothetical protein
MTVSEPFLAAPAAESLLLTRVAPGTLTATALWKRTVREVTVAARTGIGSGLLLTGMCAVAP